MCQYEGGSPAYDDRGSENLARMDENRIQCARGDQVMAQDSAPTVNKDDYHAFNIRAEVRVIHHVGTPIGCSLVGRVAKLKLDRGRAFAESLDLEFFWIKAKTALARLWRQAG